MLPGLLRYCLLILLPVWLLGCSGGGAGNNDTNDDNEAMPPPTEDRVAAARLLNQATFGATLDDIDDVARRGIEAWLDEQFAAEPTWHLPIVEEQFEKYEDENVDEFTFRRHAWWHNALTAEDQLRQRVALALSEIFVVSDRSDALEDPSSTAGYFDMLLEHAFADFNDLLLAVTLHPAMGVYLSHANNRKAIPEQGVFPDENYAREVMQLFSIGLYELNPDGSRKLDDEGKPIPTYSNKEITEMAKVFTGLSFATEEPFFGNPEPEFWEPMIMFEAYHETGEKHLLNGFVIPAGQAGMQDIRDAISHLANHPNTGPFIARRLIQRLVVSNPSPSYIGRVAAVFNNNGRGERGDMEAVVRAILLDDEARDPARLTDGGRLQEPMLRYLQGLRAVGLYSDSGRFYGEGFYVQDETKQHPLSAPSVFNFYLPDYQPSGELADAGLVAPEFQISTDTTVIGMVNLMAQLAFDEDPIDAFDGDSEIELALDDEIELAESPEEMVAHCNLIFAYNSFSREYQEIMLAAIQATEDPEDRARIAIFLSLISPEQAVAN